MPARSIEQAALAYLARGWSVVVIEPRAKRPLVRWEVFQRRAPSAADVASWFERWLVDSDLRFHDPDGRDGRRPVSGPRGAPRDRTGIGALAGRIYVFDLAGAVFGAALTGVLLVPLMGIAETILLTAALKAGSVLLILASPRQTIAQA